MPTYEYNCMGCETHVEITRSIKEEEVIPLCKKCNNPMSKIYSTFGIHFNGSGFYSTDRGKR